VVDDLTWAHKAFERPTLKSHYRVCVRYYDGVTPMAYATDKFRSVFFQVFGQYRENLCAPVVDSLRDRLKVLGFRSNQAEMSGESNTSPLGVQFQTTKLQDDEAERAWDIWTENRMDLRSVEVHEESLKCGDGYLIVWPRDDGYPELVSQYADEMRVQYASNNSKEITRASKMWWDEDEEYLRLNIYTPLEIKKYASRREHSTELPSNPDGWRTYEAPIPNPYNRVPVFHFPNKNEGTYGTSEIREVIHIQDGLNKSVIDMLVAMEFAAYKQRYAVGYEVELDPDTGEPVDQNAKNYGADRMMAFPDPDSKVGQFDATDLTQFLKVQDKFWQAASRVSGTPLHYFFITQGDFPSGEAIKSAEGRFITKIGNRQTANGNIWEDAVKFAMKIEGGVADDLVLNTLWKDATPRSEAELADTAVKKKAVGVPRSQILRELGYSEEEIVNMIAESDSEQLVKMEREAELAQQMNPEPTGDQGRSRQGVPGGG
jgi:Phage portal protein, SPP1 Gp6-like.